MEISFNTFEKVTMQDTNFAYDLLGMYISELEEYLQQLPDIVDRKDVSAYRFLNHKIRSLVNTLEVSFLLEAQTNLLHRLIKGAPEQEIGEYRQNLEDLTRRLIDVLKERRNYYAEFNNQPV